MGSHELLDAAFALVASGSEQLEVIRLGQVRRQQGETGKVHLTFGHNFEDDRQAECKAGTLNAFVYRRL
jgi:hypothetical protein